MFKSVQQSNFPKLNIHSSQNTEKQNHTQVIITCIKVGESHYILAAVK